MKKAKRVLALVLAFVMLSSCFSLSAFAKNLDPEAYRSNPTVHMNSVNTITLTAEEGATQILDLLDGLLYNLNLKFDNEAVLDEWYASAALTADLSSIDGVFYTLYCALQGINNTDGDLLQKVIKIKVIGIGVGSGLIGMVVGALDFGDVEDLSVDALGDQVSNSRVCRNVPEKSGINGASDLTVLTMLINFLSDNRNVLKKIATSQLGFGTLDGTIKGISDVTEKLFKDFPGFLKNTLYGALWNENADEAPAGWTYDQGIQDIINWLLVDGTGTTAETGGFSVLGPNAEGFLPALADPNVGNGRGADLNQSIYDLVNNVIRALLGGTIGDLLKGLLIDLLGIDETANDGKGDTAIMSDTLYNTIIGAIEGLFVANGAPAIVYSEDERTYPIPQITKLLNWLFNEGALETFVVLQPGKIGLTDNFMSLLGDVIRILPGLFPLFGLEVPEDIKIPADELSKTVTTEEHGDIYQAIDGQLLYVDDPEDIVYDTTGSIDFEATPVNKLTDGTLANTSDASRADYINPKFIRQQFQVPTSAVYAYILKIVLNMFIDGCYFPEWTDTIASVGAYGLASLAAKFIPENNYFDKLDKYHYTVELGQSYTPKGTTDTNLPALPYTETKTLSDGTQVTVPRAAADIAASIGAFFFNGLFSVKEGMGYSFEQDTNFETLILEFLMWGLSQYMTLLSGQFNSATQSFTAYNSKARAVWLNLCNNIWSRFNALKRQYPSENHGTYSVAKTPASEVAPILFDLLDGTVFQLIPANWLPNWLEESGSPSEALVYYWLADSLCKFDIQQFLGLLEANTDGELNLPVMTLLIRVIDRVLSIVVGGNAVLPPCAEGTSNRNPLTGANTSLTSLEAFLGNGQSIATFLQMLLYYLGVYFQPIALTIFPLLGSKSVKSATYKRAATDGATVNYLNNHQITAEELTDYYNSYEADQNAVPFAGKVNYQSQAKAEALAEAIGQTAADVKKINVDGADRYEVTFPATFSSIAYATAAAEAATAFSGAECYASSTTRNRRITYTILQKMDYLTTAATETINHEYDPETGAATDTWYTYTNFRRAQVVTNNGSKRTGPYGEVVYGEGYKANFTEDYPSNTAYYFIRLNDSLLDAKDTVDDFKSYTESTLPQAYGEWMNYWVNMQLNTLKLYDKDNDGVINVRYDTNPSAPSTPYPFYATSGSSKEVNHTTNKTYNFNAVNNIETIKAALSYAAETDEEGKLIHNVTLNDYEAEALVRLALQSINFDITKDENGEYYRGTFQWPTLLANATNLAKVQSLCTALGYTLIQDGEDTTIERPAFALIGNRINGKADFGTYWSYTTKTITENGEEITVNDAFSTALATISLTPKTNYDVNDKTDEGKEANNIQQAYIDFAKAVADNAEALNDHYDDISWRAEVAEDQINIHPSLNTLNFVLQLTKNAYYPAGQQNGRNKVWNLQTGDLYPAYSKSTFEAFQRAYEFGDQIKTAIENGATTITQSLVTTAYQNILDKFKKLEEYGGAADWAALLNYIMQAQDILSGPLGVDENGIVKDAENGYTQETLNNLITALAAAETLYNNNRTTFDTDHQDEVDDEATDLASVINNLKFPEGVLPDLKIIEEYTGTIDLTPYRAENDNRQLGVISGLEEGVGLTQAVADESIYVTGYQLNGNDKKAGVDAAAYGNGTGATYRVYNTVTGEVVKYYAVIIGDLNGDTRIDGADKTILAVYDEQALQSTMPTYLQAAADVDHNGEINLNDIAKIKAHYTYASQNGIDNAPIDGTISQTGSLTIIPATSAIAD